MRFLSGQRSNQVKNSSQPGKNQYIVDDFSADCRRGRVLGSRSSGGYVRQGADVEKLLSIDNGALRIRPPVHPGWGRVGIAYGPFRRQAGLALAVFMLNGHNSSEGNSIEQPLKHRLSRWVNGSEANSVANRLIRWTMSPLHRSTARRLYRWVRNHRHRFRDGHIKENLALGWFPNTVPVDPTSVGNGIVIRSSGPENGALWTRSGDRLSPAFKGLQNLQTYYVVVLRETGAAYYAASNPNAHGVGAHPYMRLVGIDAHGQDDTVYAALFQSSLGQIGFHVDTRVYGLHCEVLPALSAWYGTAQAADLLVGNGHLHNATAELGGRWRVLQGELRRTPRGLIGHSDLDLALLEMHAPAGAVHVLISPGKLPPACALLWRSQDADNTWGLFFDNDSCQLKIRENGHWSQIALDEHRGLAGTSSSAVQILDDGRTFSLYLDGTLLFDSWFTDPRFHGATRLGLLVMNRCDVSFRRLESHAHEIPIPAELQMGVPWQAEGTRTVLCDEFAGPAAELSGRKIKAGGCWRKEMGKGRIMLTGSGTARVEATRQQPNPGRLAYTVDWPNPEFADLCVDVLPPGTGRHEGEKGRGGLIFWQDRDHYITISAWLDDTYGGASLSSFFHIRGFEEIYDAVWTNVGHRITWGKQHRLRIAFDGLHFIAHVDEEPVLYRSLRDVYPRVQRLSIRRVGLVANWEWGNDTGSIFSRFIAKA